MRTIDQSRAHALADLARAALPDGSPLRAYRAAGIERLSAEGLPVGQEAWRFTPPNQLVAPDFVAVPRPGAEAVELPLWLMDDPHVVFVDGHPVSPAEQRDHPASTAHPIPLLSSHGGPPDVDDSGFEALNRAFFTDGVDLELGREARGTYHLVHTSVTPQGLSANRHRVRVAAGADVQLVEHVQGGEGTLSTGVTELSIEGGARVSYVRVVEGGPTARHVGLVRADVADGGYLSAGSFVFGGHTSRVELSAHLRGPAAEARFFGLSLLRGSSHADHHVTARHAGPEASSDQVFRSIVADASQSVYTGTVIVDKGAMGTDSNQLHQALLLSDEATVHARPWLEIYADDVKCAHGATVGSLDGDSLFYLRQRGLSEAEARGLLMWGFATGTVSEIPEGPVRDGLQARVRQWLEPS